jgi:hypothetical protein
LTMEVKVFPTSLNDYHVKIKLERFTKELTGVDIATMVYYLTGLTKLFTPTEVSKRMICANVEDWTRIVFTEARFV